MLDRKTPTGKEKIHVYYLKNATAEDLANWEVKIEEPVMTTYKGIEVYKLTHWVQGPVMLQALNILENLDLKSMGYNSGRYMHALYQTMNLAFADRDFYYGDPYFPPEEPIEGLLSKDYAKQRAEEIDWEENDPDAKPGDPYPFQGGTNPYSDLLRRWSTSGEEVAHTPSSPSEEWGTEAPFDENFFRGTTSVQAADKEVRSFPDDTILVGEELTASSLGEIPREKLAGLGYEPETDAAATWQPHFAGPLTIHETPDPHLGEATVDDARQVILRHMLDLGES